MTEDIAALQRQRNDLDQRIALAHLAARDEWNARLDAISDAVNKLADRRGLDVDEHGRKNVTTLKLGGVAVRLGYALVPEHSASLAVEGSMTRADFGSAWRAPSPAVVVAMVTALLDEEATP